MNTRSTPNLSHTEQHRDHSAHQQFAVVHRLEADQRAIFSFEGMDEMDIVNGAGTLLLEGERLIFKLMYHQGDDFTFVDERRK